MEDGSGPELYNAICALDDSSWESRIGRRFPDFPLARIIRFPRKKVERKAKGKSPFNVSRLVAASNYNPKSNFHRRFYAINFAFINFIAGFLKREIFEFEIKTIE